MKSNERHFKGVLEPRRWLSRALSEKKLSQTKLAQRLGRTPSTINKWISGDEPIPNKLFLAAAAEIGDEYVGIAQHVRNAHELASEMAEFAKRRLPDYSHDLASKAAGLLVQRAEDSAGHMSADSESDKLAALERFLIDGRRVIQILDGALSRKLPVINEENVVWHLRFPFNVMLGDLVLQAAERRRELGGIRDAIFRSMVQTARGKSASELSVHCRQHAYHMLARFGDAGYQALILELMERCSDVETRRTTHYAKVIEANGHQAADEFLYALNRDKNLRDYTLSFDLIHYGDVQFAARGRRKNGYVGGTILNNLRHAVTRPQRAATEISLYKLMMLLESHGAEPFETPSISTKLTPVLTRLRDTDSTRLTPMERHFLRSFGSFDSVDVVSMQQAELPLIFPAPNPPITRI